MAGSCHFIFFGGKKLQAGVSAFSFFNTTKSKFGVGLLPNIFLRTEMKIMREH